MAKHKYSVTLTYEIDVEADGEYDAIAVAETQVLMHGYSDADVTRTCDCAEEDDGAEDDDPEPCCGEFGTGSGEHSDECEDADA